MKRCLIFMLLLCLLLTAWPEADRSRSGNPLRRQPAVKRKPNPMCKHRNGR